MVPQSRDILELGSNIDSNRVGLTPDVVSDPPGNRGVVHGLVDPAQVGLPAF